MKCNVNVYLINDHFSQEYADEHNGGEESEFNRRFEWQDEMEVNASIEAIEENKHATYAIRGEFAGGEEFSYDVGEMRLFELKSIEGATIIGCSESILDKASFENKGDYWKLEIWLKDYEPLSNPITGIYIAAQEFPKELIKE